ncbi:nesprin-1 isoform X4 [Alosa pseudoharengus]|uniref:nesprin-1 isoform X4 n=1 Tax=Alosa pseudoharengus TaxID=34774 RepID=UPI003F8C8738
MAEMRELSGSQESPAELQVLEAELRKKTNHVRTMCEQSRSNLRDFCTQKKQLEDFISQMSEWLQTVENSLQASPSRGDPEEISRVKEVQKELQGQQDSIDSTRESLNALCRKFPSEELARLGGSLTDLIRRYDTVNQLCGRSLGSLQHSLQQRFTDLVQEFHGWLADQRDVVKECSDQSGDISTLERKLQKLKGALERVEDGESRLTRVCEEGEKLLLHLPKASAGQVQTRLSSAQQDWDSYVQQCRQNQLSLERSTTELNCFEDHVQKLQRWLELMQGRMTTELPEEKSSELEKSALQRVEEFQQEVTQERDSFETLCQEAQSLHETGHGGGGEVLAAAQLQTRHQGLVRSLRERLRSCQLGLQEQQAFEEALQGCLGWLSGVQERLTSLNSTTGNKETLETRLALIQDILLMKGEGEVRLNLALGKGEQLLKSCGPERQQAIRTQLQELRDTWASTLVTSMSCHSRLEWTVSQWGSFQESRAALQQWLEGCEQQLGCLELEQPGLKEKLCVLERLRATLADVNAHVATLAQLTDKAVELHKKTGDRAFSRECRDQIQSHFGDVTAVVKGKLGLMEAAVREHQVYLEAVRDMSDWLASAREELQRWADVSGDADAVQRKLAKVRELLASRQQGWERMTRVQRSGGVARGRSSTLGCEALEREEAGLLAGWEQWERAAQAAAESLEGALQQMASSEQEFGRLATHLEQELQAFSTRLLEWRDHLQQTEGMNTSEEAVHGWQIAKETSEELLKAEATSEQLKTQLNDLCRFSRELGTQPDRVSALIKDYNSLSLQASRECQNKEKLLDQRFRSSCRDFQQWLVHAKITTAKCFDVPQNLAEVSSSLQKIQECVSDREQGQTKLNAVVFCGDLLLRIASRDREETVRAKMRGAREDWKTLMTTLHQREAILQSLQSQMEDFEDSVEPLQDWLNGTEAAVQGSSSRLHDLAAKKHELHKLQEKASRVEHIMSEHQLFCKGLRDLHNWVSDTSHMMQSYCAPTADRSVLDNRMIKLEALLTARQEKEIELKMLVTRGESVQRNTSAEGVPAIRLQIQELKESWDTLLSASIQCKSQLEGALSQWTSYQDDVRQFVCWVEQVEQSLEATDRPCSEMRDKTDNLDKAKLLFEEVLSHGSLLDTIAQKGAGMAEHCVTQMELQDLQERYSAVREKAEHAVGRAEDLVHSHEEHRHCLQQFRAWLEQEQERLSAHTPLEGDVDSLENTLQKLQEQQRGCTEGHTLLNALQRSREALLAWGAPSLEERQLEALQADWSSHQARLGETRAQLNSTLAKLRQIEQKFHRLDTWLKGMESKGQLRSSRRSDRATKEAQLQMLEAWQEEVLVYQSEVESLSSLAQQVLEESHISSRVSATATQLTSRYHALLLLLMETIKQLKEEVSCIEEAQSVFSTFSDWLSMAQKNFSSVSISIDVVDRVAMERKKKKLEALQGDVQRGRGFLTAMREKTERAAAFLEEPEAEQMREEVSARLSQQEALVGAIRQELSTLDKSLQLSKDFLDKYKAQAQWVSETRTVLGAPLEPKAELYQRKAQLAKYKTLQQTVQSHESAMRSVMERGEALLDSVKDPTISENMSKLQADYTELCSAAKARVQSLSERVREHEEYCGELQEVERWLLQMSSRLVTSDSMQSGSLEAATQQLARHKAIMEEIAGFEDLLNALKERGEELVSGCPDAVQPRVCQQVQTQQQGTRDSYSAICSTAQRLYQSLEREQQKYVSHQDTLQQCQSWLAAVQQEVQLHALPPHGLQEALKQVKHFRAVQEQASTYLDLVCSVCDLSDETVRSTAAEIQQIKITIEERMMRAQELSEGWREILDQKQELASLFQDMEQQLQGLTRRPAELEPKIAQNMLDQAREFSQQLQSRQATLTRMTETVMKLTEGRESSEHAEISRLSHSWLELCHQANKLQAQREEDLRRTGEYHDCIAAMEALFEQVTKDWDSLARTDAESSLDHLEALKKLAVTLKDKRSTLEDLKEQRQKVVEHLNLDDKELVKEQISHFEQRWAQLESLIEKKIQDSMATLDELAQVEARLREARDWAEEQQPALAEAMKMSPPPDLAQSFLFDHLSICSELEVKQLMLAQAITDADRVLANLGLNERQRLQQLIAATQGELESLSVKVSQRRKHLSKAFTERTQFLQAVGQAVSWVQQNEKKALADEFIALLPDDLAKQVRSCRNIQSRLKAYQSELTSLWAQGRDLMRDATEEEKAEMLAKLQELQTIFEVALQRCSQRLQELEKVLATRRYFTADLEKTCQWLKQADIVTFPEINLMNGDAELNVQLTKYQQLLEQAVEYENLLLNVQRAGQDILPTLSEVNHSYLDEKLNWLPQQYNNILALAKEKQEKIQQALLARKEYASFIEVTFKALKELEEQFHSLGTQTVGLKTEEVTNLQSSYKALQDELVNLGSAVNELNQKKEGFRSTGQPWRSEEMTQLVSLYNGLKRLIEQKVEHLDDTLESFEDHHAMAMQVDSELKATKEQLVKVNAETQSAEERLKNYHSLAASLQGASSHLSRLREQMDSLALHMDPAAHEASRQQLILWQEELHSLQAAVGELIVECENRFVQSKDFETEVKRTLDWLQQVRDELGCAVVVDVKVEKVQEEIRKQQIMQEEVQSRLRIVMALSTREKQKYTSANELVPEHVDSSLQEMAKLEADVQQALSTKQITLEQALVLCQKYHSRMQMACEWLEDAVGFLQQASLGVDVENYEECLRQHEDIMASEQDFLSVLRELEDLPPQLEKLVNPTAGEQLRLSVESAQQRGVEVRDQLQCHQDVLNSCVEQWTAYQEARQTVIELMNEAEKKLTEFSTAKAETAQEAEEKLRSHKSLVSMVNSFQDKLTELEEQASQLELIGSDASKATISRSMTTVWQRWTRLRSVSRAQERVLEDTTLEWKTFRDKMTKMRSAVDELQNRLPECAAEKASKATLQSQQELQEVLSQDVERQQSAITLLQQYALSLLHGSTQVPTLAAQQQELPALNDIRALQQQLDSLLQKTRANLTRVQQELKDREGVERELSHVKTWIHQSRELLLNPTADLDLLLQELEVMHSELLTHKQNVEKIAEQQQSKYLDLYTILPSEISMQLAEVSLAMGAIEDQVQSKERDIQKSKDIKQNFDSRIQDVSEKLKAISALLKEKATDITQAKEETKGLCMELEGCGRMLSELAMAVQEFGRRNPLLAQQLSEAIGKLEEIQHHTSLLAEYRAAWLRKAEVYADEYQEMLEFTLKWTDKAKSLLKASVIWSSASHLQEQIRMYQSVLRESRALQGDLEAMLEKVELLSEGLQVEAMNQQASELSRLTQQLEQDIRMRLQNLQDAAEDMEKFESEVKNLQVSLEQVQSTLTSPELTRLSLKDQLSHRQRLLSEMESFKQQVQEVQVCQSALRVPEEAVTSLPICRTALNLQQEASQLQHTAIQQCNILQEAVVQHEQYKQEVSHLQSLMEEAHGLIQAQPVASGNIQELQAQIKQHEELAQKIRGYQEQISSLNSKCRMLTVKARHASMLLSVSEGQGAPDDPAKKASLAQPSVVMMTAGRCHTLLSPVTEESGEEGTSSEISSPPFCRSPSPISYTDPSLYQLGRGTLTRTTVQELYDPTLESVANLDDLQRSWETLKNVISEKQRSLYEALERQQRYQGSLQAISSKMEAVEAQLRQKSFEADHSPDDQLDSHQTLMDEVQCLQDEIDALHSGFSEELVSDALDSDPGHQLALQSSLSVLAERMATIRTKASGRGQLLEERMSHRLEGQQREEVLEECHVLADELHQWMLRTRSALCSTPQDGDADVEEQLEDCQNALAELEEKVGALEELVQRGESLLQEAPREETRREAELLTSRLCTLKGSLLELQRMLQDKHQHLQVCVQEQDDSESDSTLSQSSTVQDWLDQARCTRTQQQQDTLQRQKELEEQLAEQKRLLQSVATRGEEIMIQQASPSGSSVTDPLELLEQEAEASSLSPEQRRQRWERLSRDLATKLQLLQRNLEQEQGQMVFSRTTPVSPSAPALKAEQPVPDQSSLTPVFQGFSEAVEDMGTQEAVEQELYSALSATSSWLDKVENMLFSGPLLLSENIQTQLSKEESLGQGVSQVAEEVSQSWGRLRATDGLCEEDQPLMEETLDCLSQRLRVLDSALGSRCDHIRARMEELTAFQTELRVLGAALADRKCEILQKMAGILDRPAQQQQEIVAEAEEMLRELEYKLTELKVRGAQLQPDQATTNQLLKLQDAYEELVLTVGSRRSGLNQNLALKTQYERALQDLTDLLDTAQDKMAAGQKLMASSVEEVHNLLSKHKEFFQGLESHTILTETFFRKISVFVLPSETQELEQTLKRAQSILKQAHRRGVEIEHILESWTRVVQDCHTLSQELVTAEDTLAGVGLLEESEERLAERISLYQGQRERLAERQPELQQLLGEGRRLLQALGSPALESQLTLLGERWLSCSTRVAKELQRLEAILKHQSRYQGEMTELSQWLQDALERLEYWSTQAMVVPQDPEMVRDHLYTFLEFCKEVERRSPLKASVLTEGNQLLRLKRMDTAALRSELALVDSQWGELLTRIPLVQERLHQLQMEKLASRHAMSELVAWISLMDKTIQEDEENLKSAVGSTIIQEYLQKYKGFRVDVNCKQLTVDFVNQSVVQVSGQDVVGKRSDKTDFAERLGAMNRNWQILQANITERIQFLESLLESWLEYERHVEVLKAWLAAQEERLTGKHCLRDLPSVQNALKECQEMEEMVKEKEKEVEKVEEQACALVQNKTDEACAIVMETLQAVNQGWTNLDHLIEQLKISLRSVLDQWTQHKQAAEEIGSHLTEGRYSISRLRLLTGSLEAVQLQEESLQSLQEQLKTQESSLQRFASITQQLLKECHPSVCDSLTQNLNDTNAKWASLLEELTEALGCSKALLQQWQSYKQLHRQGGASVQGLEERADVLLKAASAKEMPEEEVSANIHQCSELLEELAQVQASLQQLQEVAEQLKQQVDTSAAGAIQSDQLMLTQRLSRLEQSLSRQQSILQTGVQDYELFKEQLASLDSWMKEAEDALNGQDPTGSSDQSLIQGRMEELKGQMLRFSSLAHELEQVNELGYRLPLSDSEIKRLQSLNRSWASSSALTTERFSKLQAFLLQQQTFLEKCEAWMEFLVQTEEKLAVEISGNNQSLLEQQRAHELFQAEMFSRQQILHSIISDGQKLLDQGQVEDRDEFSLKLALLSNQWQAVVRRAQQRRGIIDSQLRQWQRFRQLAEKLRRWLLEVAHAPTAPKQPIPLQQARVMLDSVQLKEKVLHRQQGSYILTVEAGRQLLLSADRQAETSLQEELVSIQARWRQAQQQLEEQRRELATLLRDWERCEKGIGGSLEKLRAFKRQLAHPLPDHQDELQTEQIRCKELEGGAEGWREELGQLTHLRESLGSCISADDLSVLKERTELLQRQWEETCHQLSLRRQQVCERLSEWSVFNEKYKDLSEWLSHMENKVSQNTDISIEEMIEKLRKDYHDEVAGAEGNRHHLQQLGERLARASQPSRASDIQHKLGTISQRWQHLLDLIAARVKKLRETLVAVQQLDRNMSSLRSWLNHIETELHKPLTYHTCDAQEIQRKLDLQQELQKDIEKHSTGVASVLNLCEVLLHDCDACATDGECSSIQQATRTLDRRWRSICALSMERRMRIEETWRLWQKFLEDYSGFEAWLERAERTAALPNSSGVLYTVAKDELKKFEAFQRSLHESLPQLELVNKQYRRLAREGRTDAAQQLKEMAHTANQRWDQLQRRAGAILRRLKHFISQREEFETSRESILVWLTEMDLQLTNIEHFSECDVQAKITQLKAFQQEIALNWGRLEVVLQRGGQLMEKSEPLDATVIEDELEELQRYCQEVVSRVDRYYSKLQRLPLLEDQDSVWEREFEMEDGSDLCSLPWSERPADSLASPQPSSSRSGASPVVLLRGAERSGRDTPASVDSIPLEWDHDYDLSRGLESAGRTLDSGHEQSADEGDFLQGGAVGLTDVVIPESPEAYVSLTEQILRASKGELGSLETHLRQLDRALDSSRFHLQQTENIIRSRTPTGPELDTSYMGYMRLLGECRGSMEALKRVGVELTQEQEKMSGLGSASIAESQTSGVIERWELLQAQAISKERRMQQRLQQWQQFSSDLSSLGAWLQVAETELQQQRQLEASTDIDAIQQRIKTLKDLQKGIDQRKAIVLSVNLCSAEFLKPSEAATAQEAEQGVEEIQARLKDMNDRWDRLGEGLSAWRDSLQEALMQCQDFHEMSHGLLLWLENIDRRRNQMVPIDTTLDRDTLQEHLKTLSQIRRELLDSQLKVASLQDMSLQLLVHAVGQDCLEAKEKVHVIGNRLKLLLKEVSRHIRELERNLDITSSQQDLSSWSSTDELDTSGSQSPVSGASTPSRRRSPRGKSSGGQAGPPESGPPHRVLSAVGSASSRSEGIVSSWRRGSMVQRVLWTALPLQLLLLLLLLALACLVPSGEHHYSCSQSNNFARSFHPMLSYTNGPPPI